MDKRWTRWILFAVTLPQALLYAWPILGLLWLFRRCERPRFLRHYGVLFAKKTKPKRFSQTLAGPAVILTPRVYESADDVLSARVTNHELRHVSQIQLLAFGCLLCAALLFAAGQLTPWGAFALWFLGPVLIHGGSYLCGWLEIGQIYYGSEFERSAFAQLGLHGEPSGFLAEYEKRWKRIV